LAGNGNKDPDSGIVHKNGKNRTQKGKAYQKKELILPIIKTGIGGERDYLKLKKGQAMKTRPQA
jgi:hypothetical protein